MKKITLLICLLTMSFMNAQLTSVSIVGDAVGGWGGNPDPIQMSTVDNVNWTYQNLTIVANAALKFRGNSSWTLPYNWGGSTFPSGTAVVDANPMTATIGTYDVTFNSTTGVYNFVALTFPKISLIGPGVSDWNTDVFLDTADGVHYKIESVALNGEVKFRQDMNWVPNNWGGTFPSGVGIVDGPGIYIDPVTAAGKYDVTFNRTTKEFDFHFPKVALVGNATPGGWPAIPQVNPDPHAMATTDGINYSLSSIDLVVGGAKFRMNDSWAKTWGGAFPAASGAFGGNDIAVSTAGTYNVTLNVVTNTYSFVVLSVPEFGSATFKAFPNPTKDVWNFSSTQNIKNVQIVDVAGKLILSSSDTGKDIKVNAAGLNAGIYFAKVTTDSGAETIKLVRN